MPGSPFPRGSVNNAGQVRVYDIPAGVWKFVNSVDAREMIAIGTATRDGAVVEMSHVAHGNKRFLHSEMAWRQEEGFELVGTVDLRTNKVLSGDQAPDPLMKDSPKGPAIRNPEVERYDLNQHTDDELRAFAVQEGIQAHSQMTRTQLIEELDDLAFDPRETSA